MACTHSKCSGAGEANVEHVQALPAAPFAVVSQYTTSPPAVQDELFSGPQEPSKRDAAEGTGAADRHPTVESVGRPAGSRADVWGAPSGSSSAAESALPMKTGIFVL